MYIDPYDRHMLTLYAGPFQRYSEKDLLLCLSKGQYLTPDEKKQAIELNNKRRKRK